MNMDNGRLTRNNTATSDAGVPASINARQRAATSAASSLAGVGSVQVDQVASSRLGKMRSNTFCQITQRIDQSESISVREVLQRHALKQGGLSGTGFPDGIDMSETVLSFDPKTAPVISVVNSS
jgi:hypothetical protein